jgi:hypothetical protein
MYEHVRRWPAAGERWRVAALGSRSGTANGRASGARQRARNGRASAALQRWSGVICLACRRLAGTPVSREMWWTRWPCRRPQCCLCGQTLHHLRRPCRPRSPIVLRCTLITGDGRQRCPTALASTAAFCAAPTGSRSRERRRLDRRGDLRSSSQCARKVPLGTQWTDRTVSTQHSLRPSGHETARPDHFCPVNCLRLLCSHSSSIACRWLSDRSAACAVLGLHLHGTRITDRGGCKDVFHLTMQSKEGGTQT